MLKNKLSWGECGCHSHFEQQGSEFNFGVIVLLDILLVYKEQRQENNKHLFKSWKQWLLSTVYSTICV